MVRHWPIRHLSVRDLNSFFTRHGLLIDFISANRRPMRSALAMIVSVGYFDARSLNYITNRTNAFLEWLRLPGDAVFIVGGALPVLYMTWLGVSRRKPQADIKQPQSVLLTDVVEAAGPQA